MNRRITTAPGIGRLPQVPALLLGALLAAFFNPPAVSKAMSQPGAASDSPPSVRVLSLEDARNLALGSAEQLAQMKQAVRGAQADVMAAGADGLPQLNVGGTWTHNFKKPAFFLPPDLAEGLGGVTSVEMGGDWDLQAAATVTLNLWTAGRLSAAKGLTEEALMATRWQEMVVADAVVYTAETAYFDLQLALAQMEIAEEALTLATENLRVIDQAHQQGRASRFDLLRAQVELTNRETPVATARNERDLKTLKLLRVCGLDHRTVLELSDDLEGVEDPAPLTELLETMKFHSPDLKALEHAIKASRMSVKLAKAGRGPVVQLQGQYALQGQWDEDIIPGSDDAVGSANATLAVSIPIFDGYAAKADIQGSEADLRTAELELERVSRNRDLGVRQSRAYLQNAIIALNGRREGVELAREAYRLAQVRLENGLATPLERLDAELALVEAQVQLAGALYACNQAEATLKLSVGGANVPVDFAEENR
jgi:outer membrane protein